MKDFLPANWTRMDNSCLYALMTGIQPCNTCSMYVHVHVHVLVLMFYFIILSLSFAGQEWKRFCRKSLAWNNCISRLPRPRNALLLETAGQIWINSHTHIHVYTIIMYTVHTCTWMCVCIVFLHMFTLCMYKVLLLTFLTYLLLELSS